VRRSPIDELLDQLRGKPVMPRECWFALSPRQAEKVERRAEARSITLLEAFRELLAEDLCVAGRA